MTYAARARERAACIFEGVAPLPPPSLLVADAPTASGPASFRTVWRRSGGDLSCDFLGELPPATERRRPPVLPRLPPFAAILVRTSRPAFRSDGIDPSPAACAASEGEAAPSSRDAISAP